jgi:class 3 adenylate cyclase/tetratricopeptide (TPR) repeat protein
MVRHVADCTNCGEQNPDGARFCSHCGKPLAAPTERHEARKVVTVVFCDIADSTGLAERLDPEVVRVVMSRYFEAMREVLERHGGTIEKFIGDAVMAVFGVPTLREDDAVRAVAAAAEMGAAREALNDELEQEWGVRISTRTGVNTGEVLAGDPSRGDSFVSGDAVNLAARLEQNAGVGEVLLGDTTARLVRHAAALEDAGLVRVKGKAEPVGTWRLVRMVEARRQARRSAAPLVGRGPQIAALERSFERAREECRCQLVTVLGPAGIGKSRLVEELLERVAERARVARGRCLSYGTLTYWPLAEVVRELAEIDEGASPEEAAAAITTLMPDRDPGAARRVAAALGVGEAPSSLPEEIFAAVRQLFDQAACDEPLVILFDDVHWGERTFLDLLEYLPQLPGEAPILIVCTARRDLLEARPQWADGELIELEPLDSSEIGAILTEVAGGVPPPRPVVELLHRAAGGNPLFAEEMLRMLLEEQALERQNGSWRLLRPLETLPMPPSINALLAARLEGLPEAQRMVVERAAVVGGDFSVPLLAELCDGVDKEVVAALVRSGVIRPLDPAGVTYGFAHLLMRDVAYQALPKLLRAQLHERLAKRGAVFVGERDEVTGYHLEQAYRYRRDLGAGGVAVERLGAEAAAHLSAAGRRANHRGDLPAVVGLLGRAQALLPALHPERLALLPELGEALCDVGDLSGAEAVLAGAVEDAQQAGDPRVEMSAALVQAYAASFTDAEQGLERLRSLAEQAIELFGSLGDDAGLARAWQALGIVHVGACHWAAASEARRHGLAHARAAGDHGLELRALSGLAYALYFGPEPADSAILAVESEILPRARGYGVAEGAVLGVLGGLLSMQARFDEARELHARGAELFAGLGAALPVAEGALSAADTELLAGAPAAAEELLRSTYAALKAADETAIRASVAAVLALALYEQGRDEEALEFTLDSEATADSDDVQAQASWRAVRARVVRRRGEQAEADRLAREAVALARGTDDPNLTALALIAAGSVDEAAALYDAKGNVAALRALRARA